MGERVSRFRETLHRYKEFARGGGEASEDVDSLMAPGRIEELVREGRIPVNVGEIGFFSQDGWQTKLYYEMPPVGFDPRDIRAVREFMGVHVFVNKLGVKRVGITFTLNEDQARQVEERIAAEELRLGRDKNVSEDE